MTSVVGDALTRLANKDLSQQLTADLPSAYDRLKADFNSALSQLSGPQGCRSCRRLREYRSRRDFVRIG